MLKSDLINLVSPKTYVVNIHNQLMISSTAKYRKLHPNHILRISIANVKLVNKSLQNFDTKLEFRFLSFHLIFKPFDHFSF